MSDVSGLQCATFEILSESMLIGDYFVVILKRSARIYHRLCFAHKP